MKKHYDGLEVYKISVKNGDFIATSNCIAMIQLQMENGICITNKEFQQIEYVGNQG